MTYKKKSEWEIEEVYDAIYNALYHQITRGYYKIDIETLSKDNVITITGDSSISGFYIERVLKILKKTHFDSYIGIKRDGGSHPEIVVYKMEDNLINY